MTQILCARSIAIYVNAIEMTRQEYNDIRGWTLPEGENGDDEGFLIEDPAGQKNTPDYDGYVTWMTKAEFERKFTTDKTVTEQELAEKAVAPRVTKEQIDALMRRVTYVTVQQPGDTTSTFVHAYLDGSFFMATLS